MFNERAFGSWPMVLAGAAMFATLFALAGAMAEALFDGNLRLTRNVVAFGVAAFAGYLFVAALLRHGSTSAGDP